MATTISHDAFARFEFVRERIDGKCKNCGQPSKFRYGSVPDDRMSGRVDWVRGGYCSVGGFRAV